MARSALAKNPSTAAAATPDIKAQMQRRQSLLAQIHRRGGIKSAPGLYAQLQATDATLRGLRNPQAAAQPGTTPTDPVQGPPEVAPGFDDINHGANQGIADIFSQISNQGAFNPGTFDQLQQQAQDNYMQSFNRQMDPVFAKQREDWQQMAAERGWDPTSKPFADAYNAQISNPQNQARQEAANQSFQQGLAAQSQAFGQAQTRYQMPYQNLGAYAPFYGAQANQQLQQGQQQFAAGQNAIDRTQQITLANLQQGFAKELAALQQRYQMQQLKFSAAHQGGGGGGGGGGAPAADPYNAYYDALISQGAGAYDPRQPLPSAGSGFASGVASGIGMGLGAGLR